MPTSAKGGEDRIEKEKTKLGAGRERERERARERSGRAKRQKARQIEGGGGREIKIAERREIRHRLFPQDVVTTTTRGGGIITRRSPLTPATVSVLSSQTCKAMDERPSTHTFPNFHHHHHRTSCHLPLPSLQSPEIGYPSAQSPLDGLEQFEIQGEESTTSFPTSSTSSGRRRESGGGGDIDFTNISGYDGNAGFGGHLDGERALGGHFADSWFGKKEEVWEDGENDVFYSRNCSSDDAGSCRARANYNSYGHLSCEAREEPVYNREVCRRVDHGRLDSRVNNGYLEGEDFGSSSGSGEDPPPSAGMEPGPWLSFSPSNQVPGVGESRWRGETDLLTLASGCQPLGLNSGTYTQKLDSFSDAFPSHRKRGFPMYSGGNAFGLVWEHGVGQRENPGLVNSRQSCAFDSFPSPPPAASHLMSSVLSPPPTPLPPSLHSPSKMDSPSAFGGTTHLVSQGGEPLGMLQFFPSLPQAVPSVHPSGVIWKLPLLTTCFPPLSGDPSSNESNSQSSHGADYSNITGPQNILQSPESSFIASSSHRSPLNTLRAPKNTSLHSSSLHLPVCPSQPSGQHYDVMDQSAPRVASQKVKNGPPSLIQSQPQHQASPIYTGTPFPSILHSGRDQRWSQYTPHPLLNPVRKGAGLYSSLLSAGHREEWTSGGDEAGDEAACINVGHDFQAEVPPCLLEREGADGESPKEQLLWKPWDELNKSPNLQDQVEKLLMMCSSSCLPGGGNNTELALHCLHHCKGNFMAALEMLLFSQPSPTPDYHYSGSDVWTDSERSLFSAALRTHGKYFSLIQKKVRTKTVCQCVEFYYLSKKLQDMQKKQKEEEDRDRRLEQQKNVPPMSQPMNRQFGQQEAVHVPALASFFPCKLCGKMFYKIKSRNAHMKIHRQPQEDWADRRLQQQLLTQRLSLNLPTTQAPTPGRNLISPQALTPIFSSCGLDVTSRNNVNADNVLNAVSGLRHNNASSLDHSAVIAISNANAHSNSIPIDSGDSGLSQREPTSIIPFHQSWSLFGHNHDPTTFYCEPEGKESLGAETGTGKDPINWQ
ncbi:uncharacterized protein LOC143012689 isoform X2 [Genypterus blacodes]|uniref:uncharacterized protein LOC143012689 isoform X2 n=1 Tax=Genypterus blacodes TaxID=154954 RepID=UPI003F76C695